MRFKRIETYRHVMMEGMGGGGGGGGRGLGGPGELKNQIKGQANLDQWHGLWFKPLFSSSFLIYVFQF